MRSTDCTPPSPTLTNRRNPDPPLPYRATKVMRDHSRRVIAGHLPYWCIACQQGRRNPDCRKHGQQMVLVYQVLVRQEDYDKYKPLCS